MEQIKTRDGSVTFCNPSYDEAYHSKTIGALEEAEKKYVHPLHLKPGNVVLDFCFGLGYNSLMAMAAARGIKIIALENDRHILEKIQGIEVPNHQELYKKIKCAAREHFFHDKDYSIFIYLGDARTSMKFLKKPLDGVLFDPFSPKKCPELWTAEVFSDIFRLLKPGGRLTTYSCARMVRENLASAGFIVEDGPILGRKSPATVAVKPKS